MSSSATPSRRRGSTPMALRALLVLGFLLAAAATVLVFVFSDQVRLLRIAVLLALWAALVAAFAVARSRREAQAVAARENEMTRTYQLELHREVMARREHEATVIENARDAAEDRNTEELKALRAQLDRLTATLTNLLDGDLLIERLTLSAEATMVRGLGESGRGQRPGLTLADRSFPELTNTVDAVPEAAPAAEPAPMVEAQPEPEAQPAEPEPEAQPKPEPEPEPEPAAQLVPEPADESGPTPEVEPDEHPAGEHTSDSADLADPDEPAQVDDPGDPDDGKRISASDLLAAFGATAATGGRRRRRAED